MVVIANKPTKIADNLTKFIFERERNNFIREVIPNLWPGRKVALIVGLFCLSNKYCIKDKKRTYIEFDQKFWTK